MAQPPYVPGTTPPAGDWKPPAPRSRALPWLIAALVVSVLVVAGLIFALLSDDGEAVSGNVVGDVVQAVTESGPTLAEAKVACDPPDGGGGVTLHDGNKTLIVDTRGEEDASGASANTLYCVLGYLKTPVAVIEHMDSTRALDGRQTDSWGEFTAGWTYHPDDGMDLTIQER